MLIAHWPLTGDLNDISGNNINLIDTTSSTTDNGKIGQSLRKTGGSFVSDLTDIPQESTISLWFKHNGVNWLSECLFGTRTGSNGFMVYRNDGDGDGYYRVYYWYNTTGGAVAGYNTWPGISGLVADRWYHLSLVRYSNGNMDIYLDGILINSQTAPADFASWHNNGQKLAFHGQGNGSGYTSGDYHMNDLRVYDKALSLYEIKELAYAKIIHYNSNSITEEPTENLSDLSWHSEWNNSGTATWNYDDNIPSKPIKDQPIFSVTKDTDGSTALIVGYTPTEPSTTYTLSVYFWMDWDGIGSTPYLRAYPANASAGTLKWEGNNSSDWSTWPQKTWIRLYGTFTSAVDATYVAISSYINTTGAKFAFNGWQGEKKDHYTKYTSSYRGPEIPQALNISYDNMSAYTAYYVISSQSNGNLTLTAQGDNRTIALQISGYSGSWLQGRTMLITGRIKRNGTPQWHNSTRLNTYHTEADSQMYFDPTTGDFVVIEYQSTDSPWIFHCAYTNLTGDIITIENLKIRELQDSDYIVNDLSSLANNGFTNNMLSPELFLDNSNGLKYIKSTNNFNGIFTKDITDGASNGFSFSIWFKTDISNTNRRPLITKTNPIYATSGGTHQMLVCLQDNHPQVHFWGGSDPGISDNVVGDGWHHFAGTYEYSTRLMNLYLDGVKKVSNFNTAESGMTPNSLHRWHIGMNPRPYSVYTPSFDGDINEVRIYADILSDEYIQSLYQRGASTDLTGNFFSKNINETKHKPLALDFTVWEDGQTGSIGVFGQNGDTAENSRIISNDPWGKPVVVWETSPDAASGPDGGWNTSYIPIDKNYPYRWSIWVRRPDANTGGTFYLGLNPAPIRNDNDTSQSNPYFTCPSQSSLTAGQWYLVVGHIMQESYTGGRHPDSGWYTVEGGKEADKSYCNLGSAEGRWAPSTTSAQHRCYHYYSTNINSKLQFLFPRIDKIDGTEPTIEDLLSGHDSRNYEYIRENPLIINPLDIKNGLSNITNINEVDGTSNGQAVQILKDGTLLINGEFSEVD